ncbi:DUF6879 family protein [Nocardia lijiangensis]|uniref:DUF6879 family protein n=1 Tax=Nocardia lijiangensis TaxID=299618 RepID=UPI0008327F50
MQFEPVDPWPALFAECERSAFHLEVRDAYAVPSESEPFRRFLAGEPVPTERPRPWTTLMRNVTDRGVAVSRVRVVTVPHSDYHRWLLSITSSNVEAGEDIRYLPRHLVDAEDIPADDAWLFDAERVAFNLIDENAAPAGAAITTDSWIVERYEKARQRLWAAAIPFGEYAASVHVQQ